MIDWIWGVREGVGEFLGFYLGNHTHENNVTLGKTEGTAGHREKTAPLVLSLHAFR